MASSRQAEMKIPVRPAPAPPRANGPSTNNHRSPIDFDNSYIFFNNKLARSQSTGRINEKKKPPPRPPPPRVLPQRTSSKKQPSHLLSNLFSRKANIDKNSGGHSFSVNLETPTPTNTVVPSGALIDFHSPPSSPTLTTRSSSDGVSIDSFGSDGFMHGVNSSGSQVESGFEDDFDFFMASTATTPVVSDPWSNGRSIDPFSPPRQTVSVPASSFDLSNDDPRARRLPVIQPPNVKKPTIIRAKNNKPARPPPPRSMKAPDFATPVQEFDPPNDWSPPMPSCPPPPPPPEIFDLLANGPKLPPRPTTLLADNTEKKKPYCIAQFDYEANHPDDLSFKVNDVISLTDRVNDEWLRGRLMGKEGMFPASFVKVIVPLEDSAPEGLDHYASVIALFTFKPETWDDLPFQEGDTVRILRRVNDDWLYGECSGRRGQFPSPYVSDVSAFFPLAKPGL